MREELNALIRKARSLGMRVRLVAHSSCKSKQEEPKKQTWHPDEWAYEYKEVPSDAPCTIHVGLIYRHIYKDNEEDYIHAKHLIYGAAESIGRLKQ